MEEFEPIWYFHEMKYLILRFDSPIIPLKIIRKISRRFLEWISIFKMYFSILYPIE